MQKRRFNPFVALPTGVCMVEADRPGGSPESARWVGIKVRGGSVP